IVKAAQGKGWKVIEKTVTRPVPAGQDTGEDGARFSGTVLVLTLPRGSGHRDQPVERVRPGGVLVRQRLQVTAQPGDLLGAGRPAPGQAARGDPRAPLARAPALGRARED